MRYVVADVGGTTLRAACWDPATEALSAVHRAPVLGTGGLDSPRVTHVQQAVVDQLVGAIEGVLASPGGRGARTAAVAFAGPVTADGTVTGAPTVWGGGGPPVPLARLLRRRVGIPVSVVNDTTAAAWRYAATEEGAFCLFTISSGISNKVFRDGQVLVESDGRGGELGHLLCDPSPDAPRCDCGGRGHLGALASGRALLAAARVRAERDAPAFRKSALHDLTGGDPTTMTSQDLARSVRDGDRFATGVLRGGLAHLAHAVSAVYLTVGVRRFVLIGGFALAVGEPFVEILADELEQVGCFGLSRRGTRGMVRLGAADDDHALIGAGRMLRGRELGTEREDARTDIRV
jgi:glucokinase